MKKKLNELLESGVERAMELMSVAANNVWRFGKGTKFDVVFLSEDEVEEVANYALSLGDLSPLAARDGRFALELIKIAPWAIMILGESRKSEVNYNCGACGFRSCSELNRAETVESLTSNGPACIFKVLDLNMAANAAASVAWRLGFHCRVFSTLAFAAKALDFIESDIVVGVAISASKFDPFFDRYRYFSKDEWKRIFDKEFPTFSRGFIGAVE